MTLDAGNKQFVRVSLGVLDKVRRCLLCRNSNERNTLVSRLEPDDLWPFDRTTLLLFTTVTFTLATLSFLLLLGSSRRRTQKSESTREQLPRHALDDGDDMSSELRLDLVGNPGEKSIHNKMLESPGKAYSSSSKSISPCPSTSTSSFFLSFLRPAADLGS